MTRESAVEIMVFKPDADIPIDQRGVHENLWIKQRFKQYVSIGVYLDGSDLRYYFFENCHKTPTIYTSFVELKKELPSGLENVFENTPKLFIMGHSDGGSYGLCNTHGSSERIYGANFDKIITDFKTVLFEQHDEIFVTLESCNADNRALSANKNYEKTFLERLSATHPKMTFCGTGPWDPEDEETGYRSSGGFPTLNVPITATGGDIWKNGNSVIFYHGNYQVVVIKSLFASTQTAKELKINTIEYAYQVLKKSSLDSDAIEQMIIKICSSRDILKIKDLKKISGFPQDKFDDEKIIELVVEEKRILEKERNNYNARVRKILVRVKSGEKFTDRDLLMIALGLKDYSASKDLSVFKGHEDLRNQILTNETLLQLIMVTCGKVLIAGPSNDSLIDFLLERHIAINSVDEKGMTALHHAVQNFYNYRKEPLDLINKFLDCGLNCEAKDKEGRTPLMLATKHSQKGTVDAGENLLALLQQRLFKQSLLNPAITSGQNANCFFQSFVHIFTRLPDKIHLQLLQDSQYKLSLQCLIENFNQAYSKPFNLKELIKFSRTLHPLDRERVFGPVLRTTYNALVKSKLIQTEPLGLGEHDIVLSHQTVAFANCYGARLSVYMPEEELNKARENGMPAEVANRVAGFKVVVNDAFFVCDRQTKQPDLWEVNLVFAGVHLNYTHGTPLQNLHEREQVIIRQSAQGACFASAPVDSSSASLFSASTEDILALRMVKLLSQTEFSSTDIGFFRKGESGCLEEHQHDDTSLGLAQ